MNAGSIAVALSGGVDSAAAALLLQRRGASLLAAHLRLLPVGASAEAEAAFRRNAADARRIAERLGVPFEIVDLSGPFESDVVRPFVRAYFAGRTPNPCVLCNPAVKLGLLAAWARDRGAETVATGHYVRLEDDPATGRRRLRRAVDRAKDQTYYLHRLGPEALARFRAPLGALAKDDVRALVREAGLPAGERGESQDVCFIPEGDYRRFLEARPEFDPRPGDVVDLEGRVLGRHEGVHAFTVGQRRGVGVGGPGGPYYVVALRPEAREVVVGAAGDLLAAVVEVEDVVWSGVDPLCAPLRACVQLRYRSPAAPALLEPLGAGGRVRVRFDAPQRAAAPGQSAVFYDAADAFVLGGGLVRAAHRPGENAP